MKDVLDEGPFFHGTKADLRAGDLLTAGFRSNYRPEVVMNHIYFTALPDGAGLAAELAPGPMSAPVLRVTAWKPGLAVNDDAMPSIRASTSAARADLGNITIARYMDPR